MTEEELADMQARKQLMLELATALYDKSTTYAQFILAAGYAAFLTVWSSSREYLSPGQARISVALILFSLLVFILWELVKMISSGLLQKRQAAVIGAPADIFWAEMDKLRGLESSFLLRLMGAWPVVLALTIIPGVLGAVLLMWGLVTHKMF